MAPTSDTDELVQKASRGDSTAVDQLMAKHRERLRRMVAVRMDPRLAVRLDPSDIVQEVLADAAARLPQYLREQPVAFYPWLRQIAWDRLIDLYRTHVQRHKRTVDRERTFLPDLSDESVVGLAGQPIDSGPSPSAPLLRDELHQRVRDSLAQLEPRDREVLVMRHLEQLSIHEVAEVLGISEGAVKMRRLRAIQRLRDLLDGGSGEKTR